MIKAINSSNGKSNTSFKAKLIINDKGTDVSRLLTWASGNKNFEVGKFIQKLTDDFEQATKDIVGEVHLERRQTDGITTKFIDRENGKYIPSMNPISAKELLTSGYKAVLKALNLDYDYHLGDLPRVNPFEKIN